MVCKWGQLSLVLVVMLAGCPSTKVVKNPGPEDTGIRYYRPKPYLMISPGAEPGLVTISMQQLPDYCEEYSIHIKSGLGINNTNVTLEDGWNLIGLQVNIDSQADELIGAIANAATAVGSLKGDGGGDRIQAKAKDVPMGLYEAVLGCDNYGCKRLYGWRYVGFIPFAQCPLQGGGGPDPYDCACPLWALLWEEDTLTFKRIDLLAKNHAKEDTALAPSPALVPAPAN